MLLNGPNDTPPGNLFGGGPFVGFEGTGFFGGAALNKFPGDLPRTLTLKTIDVTGKPNLKLTVALAASFLDFETSDYLDFKVYEDGTDPTTVSPLMHFTAPTGNDKFFNDVATNPKNPTKLALRFQDVTYDIPAGIKKLVVRAEALTTWWNEIVAFDNIRVTSGAAVTPTASIRLVGKNISIEFTGVLQSAATVTGPWNDVTGNPTSPFVLQANSLASAQFYRARGP